MKKSVRFVWGQEQEHAFYQLKKAITHQDVLACFENDCESRIVTDASPVGLGAVLTQLQNGFWSVISYSSRNLINVDSRYSQPEKEALAIYMGK